MKYKKYFIFILLIMIFGINKVNAEECYYQSNEISLYYNAETGKFRIDQRNINTDVSAPKDPLINRGKDVTDNYRFLYFSGTGITVKAIPVNECPEYIVYRRFDGVWFFNSDGVWGFNNYSDANEFMSASNQISNRLSSAMASYKNDNGSKISKDDYYGRMRTLKQTDSTYNVGGLNTSDSQLSCEELFDPSIVELVNDILKYPRYIVPVIIIVLGTLDFFKAVIANKEDEMKKAQATFIKRLLIGTAVFLVPVIVNVIMWLANIAWEGLGYTTCNF